MPLAEPAQRGRPDYPVTIRRGLMTLLTHPELPIRSATRLGLLFRLDA